MLGLFRTYPIGCIRRAAGTSSASRIFQQFRAGCVCDQDGLDGYGEIRSIMSLRDGVERALISDVIESSGQSTIFWDKTFRDFSLAWAHGQLSSFPRYVSWYIDRYFYIHKLSMADQELSRFPSSLCRIDVIRGFVSIR